MASIIKQGDAYALPVGLTLNGMGIAAADIDTVEFYINTNIRKLYPQEVSYDEQNSIFYVPMTQEESFSLPEDELVAVDARVKFSGGNVMGVKTKDYVLIADATSEVVL